MLISQNKEIRGTFKSYIRVIAQIEMMLYSIKKINLAVDEKSVGYKNVAISSDLRSRIWMMPGIKKWSFSDIRWWGTMA